ncbi:PilW family protein [Halomonas alkalisoli]|uniref:PilW family protein n=1 Tax=Halomonas alkalisoli TaxID=2907158 RepID=UPI001F2085AA|nr:prepilin-type N-terminal cleavage/methylation domain-containing protein [Halomonas alkalisoli]MCE9683042.1 prepilin-type N-terminal cleavage/methylation domain-containing protein [Halomonas alkalisoli]
MSPRQGGFSLVELMVSLVIGLVIILGAGQLFLTGFQNFQQLRVISDKQAALTFAAEILLRDVRRAEEVSIGGGGNELIVKADDETYVYSLDESSSGWSLYLSYNGNSEPVVDGFKNSGSFRVEEKDDIAVGFYEIIFQLFGEAESIVFHVMNRTDAVNPPPPPPP